MAWNGMRAKGTSLSLSLFGSLSLSLYGTLSLTLSLSRGKHDGMNYFTVKVPGSASFFSTRSPGLCFGRGFFSCSLSSHLRILGCFKRKVGLAFSLNSRYLGSAPLSQISLGSSNGVLVETVGWDKIQKRLQKLDEIKEIGLNNMGVSWGELGAIHQTCPLVEDVDLSKNLLSSLTSVAEICHQLPNLRILRLNHNRFTTPLVLEPKSNQDNFTQVEVLTLVSCLLSWRDIADLYVYFPSIQEIHAGHNAISSLQSSIPINTFQTLKVIDLEHNSIDSWEEVLLLGSLPSLENLNVAYNKIPSIQEPSSSKSFPSLKTLNISRNILSTWTDIHFLNSFQVLENIRLVGNPIVESLDMKIRHIMLVGRLSKVARLNGSHVSFSDRRDSECYYLSQAHQDIELPDFANIHPRYEGLCKVHGTPATKKIERTIADVLITLYLQDSNGFSIQKKVSKHTTLRLFKTMLARTIWPKEWQKAVRGSLVWVKEEGDEDMSTNDDMRSLDYCDVVMDSKFTIKWF
jgi:Leucine-rich repeat (LRR) protein